MIIKEFLGLTDSGGFCELNERYKGVHIQDGIIKLHFRKLYTNLIIKFHEEGLIPDYYMRYICDKSNTSIEILKSIIKQNDYSNIDNCILNVIFSNLNYKYSSLVSGYMNSILSHYYNISDSVIYIDTDTIYMEKLENEDFIKSISLPYETSVVSNIFFIKKKVYFFEEDLKIKKRGFSKINNFEELVTEMKSNIRNKRIKELGI